MFDTGILGINARNLLYIKPFNQKKAIMLADDKLKTKAFLKTRGIPVPKLYGVIANKEELEKFDPTRLPTSFVVKPNHGFGGEGIIPVSQHRGEKFMTIDGEQLSWNQLKDHIQDILDGRYAITGVNDDAFFEHLIISEETLAKYSYKGLPDIRIVVHNLIPVMAMLRLPTKESRGKANLHQGAIGTGIDIAKGEVTHTLYRNRIIHEIPGVGPIKGLKIPFWDDILMIASKAQLATNLGYMAADVAIDKHYGPILLEINARAGLGVQIANLAPLKRRLERIKGIKITTPEKAIRMAKDMFGRTIEKNIEHMTGKQVVSVEEPVELISKNGTHRITAFLNTGRERSVVDETFAMENGFLEDPENYNDEKSTLKLKFSLAGKRIQTVVDLEKITRKNCKMIIGQRDLAEDFLIDPTKKIEMKHEKPIHALKKSFDAKAVDQALIDIESKIKLLYYLRPLNLEEEKQKFLKNFSHSPQFVYAELKFDGDELRRKLSNLIYDDSPIGILLEKKSQEVQKKIALLEKRGTDEFYVKSIDLFGKPSAALMIQIEQILQQKISFQEETESITMLKAKELFQNAFDRYGLKNWKVQIKEDMVTNCVAGKNNKLFLKKNAQFTPKRIKNLIIHEIETHILTAENGKLQPYESFNRGFAGYLVTQEGFALYNVETHGEHSPGDRFYAAALVKATQLAEKLSFTDVFLKMLSYGLPQERAFRIALKIKRGFTNTASQGAFTKDYLYMKGLQQIQEFVQKGGKVKDLYYGKYHLEDLSLIKKIPRLVEPKLLPEWLK